MCIKLTNTLTYIYNYFPMQEEDESKMHHTDLDVDSYTSVSVDYSTVQGTQQIDRLVQLIIIHFQV